MRVCVCVCTAGSYDELNWTSVLIIEALTNKQNTMVTFLKTVFFLVAVSCSGWDAVSLSLVANSEHNCEKERGGGNNNLSDRDSNTILTLQYHNYSMTHNF